MKFNPNRCDQCAKQHKKCDNILPACSRCITRKVDCTYLMKFTYSRNKSIVPKTNLVNFRLNKNSSNTSKTIKDKEKLNNSWNLTRLEIIKLPNGMGQINSPLETLKIFPRLSLLENLLTLIQYPSLVEASDDLGLLLRLIDKLGLLATKKTIIKKQEISKRPKSIQLNIILEKAINNYFLYNNTTFPIFLNEGFDFFSKPLVLRLAIMGCGLMWMKQDEGVRYLISFISFHLYKKLHSIHLIKPNFQMIQAILILLSGFHSMPWLILMRPFYLIYCYRTAIAFGLHLPNKRLDSRGRIERSLTYSSLNILFAYSIFNNSSSIHMPQLSSNFIIRYQTLFNKPINNSDFNLLSKSHNLLIIHIFHSSISPIIYSIGTLKLTLLLSKLSTEILIKRSYKLLEGVNKVQTYYIGFISQNCSSSNILTNVYQYILFICHSLRFMIYSIYFYRTTKPYSNEQIQTDTSTEIINKILVECKGVIQVGKLLPHHFHTISGVASISQCMIFLIRYKKYSKLDYQTIIEEGFNFLKSIKYSMPSKLAQFNLHFISVIDKYVNPQLKIK